MADITVSSNVDSFMQSATYAAMKVLLSLDAVENTALSTWAGSANLTTTGTLTTGATGVGFTLAFGSSTITGTLPAAQMPALTGDVTTIAGALAATLATVNANTGSWGTATQVPQITLNGKGLATAAGNVTITPAEASITFTDITTNNVSTTKHGFAPKAPNDATKYLDGTGAYSVPAGTGTVTTVGFTGGLISVANPTTTPAFTVAGTSGGIPYFSSASTWASSGALASGSILSGGGAGNAPVANTTAGGILTFIGSPTSANLAAVLTDETGTNKAVFSDAPTLNVLNVTGLVTGTTTGIGVAQTNGLLLTNTTAAANNSQQYSPAIELDANGWATGASSSQSAKWAIQNQTIQGSSSPSSNLNFLFSVAGGGFTSKATLNSAGAISWVGTCTSGTDITVSSGGVNISTGGNFHVTGRSQWQSSADGLIDLYNNGFGNFTRINFGGVSNSFNGIGRDAVNGFTFQSGAGTSTWNDPSTGNSGTVANRYMVGIAAPTLTATGTSVTDTVASTFYIGGAPTASTNTTIGGTPWALNVAAGPSNFGGPVVLPKYTVATLPSTVATGMVQGATAVATDLLAPTFLGIVAGGGSTVSSVLYNGTNWVVQ